ncbi:MAG TPA: hydrogenase assembly protein HupF [Candidatus Dormibacteraeota bacterium]
MNTECRDEVCITCSDQLLSMIVRDVDAGSDIARGTIDGQPVEVSVELLDNVVPGDVLLCHGGVALQRDPTREEVRA